jgi:L-alanine-DL-glutamate epimerase-like enolase superfamily enzyme
MTAEARVDRLDVSVHRVPTDSPESDGTIEWGSTTVVVVEAGAAGKTGIGYTYTATAAAQLIDEYLRELVVGSDVFAVGKTWHRLGAALRNVGRPGVAMCALSAVDAALWDLKARLLGVPLVELLPRFHDEVAVYGSGGFTSYAPARVAEQLAAWVDASIPRVKMKIGRDPDADAARLDAARRAIGDAALYVDANGAYAVKEAVRWAARLEERWDVTWFEELFRRPTSTGSGRCAGRRRWTSRRASTPTSLPTSATSSAASTASRPT